MTVSSRTTAALGLALLGTVVLANPAPGQAPSAGAPDGAVRKAATAATSQPPAAAVPKPVAAAAIFSPHRPVAEAVEAMRAALRGLEHTSV